MMEGLGYISTAEAFIVARDRSAWNAALRLAKTKGIYTGVDIEPLMSRRSLASWFPM